MFKRLEGKDSANGSIKGVPERLGGQDLEGQWCQSMEAQAGASLLSVLMAQSNVIKPKALSPQADPSRNFGRAMQAGQTRSSQWIALLVPHMESTMARWDADTSFQLGSSSASPCRGLLV